MPYRIRFVITLLTAMGWCGAQSSSFLFNMQPARITATVGTGGRNIRHLPCVSRKTGAEGVCMFAIDCLKANGTHLGTCIDRFYFGSCCSVRHPGGGSLHDSIVPVPGLLDNTIDGSGSVPIMPPSGTAVINDLIPILKPIPVLRPDYKDPTTSTSRPSSTSTTTERFVTTQKVDTTTTSTQPTRTTVRTTASTPKPISTTQKVVTNSVPSSARPSQTTRRPVEQTTLKSTTPARHPTPTANRTTTTPLPVKTNGTKVPSVVTTARTPPAKTTQKYKPTTQVLNENEVVKVTTTSAVSTENPYKISTFQSVVHENKTSTSTAKPSTDTRPVQRPASTKPSVTPRPPVVHSTSRPKPTSKPPQKPRPTTTKKPTQRPQTVAKPTKTPPRPVQPVKNATTSNARPPIRTTPKPIRITSVTTQKPLKTTQRPVETTSTPLVTTQFVKTTKRPVENTTKTETTTTTKPVKVTTTTSVYDSKPPTMNITSGLPVLIPISTLKPVDTTTTTTTSRPTSTEQFTTSSSVNSGSGPAESVATNEVLPPDETRPPGLVTWTSILEGPTMPPTTNTTHLATDKWTPLTTPDGWVLLPSVSTDNISTQTNATVKPSTERVPTTSSRKPPPMMFPTEPPSRPSAPASNGTPVLFPDSTIPPAVTVKLPDVASQTMPVMFPDTTSYRPPIMIAGLSPIPPDMMSSVSGIDAATTTESVAPNLQDAETNGTSPAVDQIEDYSTSPPLNMSDYTQVCGRRLYPQARIVGGERSSFGKWPWQISLRQWRTSTYLHKCGAALLNENWAITAAHCVDNVPPSDLLLRLGEHDLSSEAEPYGFQERRVQIIASHPQFDPRTFEYDLALLRFYEPVTFQPNIIPVCVPDSDERFVGKTAFVTGWGRLYEDGPLPNVLQQVTVPVINNTVCEYMYRSAGYIEHIPEIFICAGWRRGGFDSCEGDSGGPMVIQRPDKRFILAGVISWGIGCAEPNQPGVYTRISEFRHWINQILQF